MTKFHQVEGAYIPAPIDFPSRSPIYKNSHSCAHRYMDVGCNTVCKNLETTSQQRGVNKMGLTDGMR